MENILSLFVSILWIGMILAAGYGLSRSIFNGTGHKPAPVRVRIERAQPRK